MAKAYEIQIEIDKKMLKRLQENRKAMVEALDLIDYMHKLTSVEVKEFEHYSNRVMNVIGILDKQINKYQ